VVCLRRLGRERPLAVAANPITGKVDVVNDYDGTVSVVGP
jgi:hypothetical protein